MIRTPWRNIPQTMGTQHPDNASAPYWEKDSDGFVSIQEEVTEAASAFQELGCEEYMWDWEGKFVDESVVEKLLTEHYTFFKKNRLGKDRFLTFRIPNIWQEKGRSLARAFMNILTSEEFARDLSLHTPPLFEVILPMADDPQKLVTLQKMFADLARAKHDIFADDSTLNHIEIIPLIEGVEHMSSVDTFLTRYVELYKKTFHKTPHYIRVFIARSDPAMMSGMIPAMLGNVTALSQLRLWSKKTGIPTFPWIGAGSLPFRGFLNPTSINIFTDTYRGCRSVSIQSAFRYDYPLPQVKKAIAKLHTALSSHEPRAYDEQTRSSIRTIQQKFERSYQDAMLQHTDLIARIAKDIPKRRERRLHIGLLGYGRKVGKSHLPRAISFTAAWYSIGLPPELLGLSKAMQSLSVEERAVLDAVLPTLREHITQAYRFYNVDALAVLRKKYPKLSTYANDAAAAQEYIGKKVHTSSTTAMHHAWTLTTATLLCEGRPLTEAIAQSSAYRKSIG